MEVKPCPFCGRGVFVEFAPGEATGYAICRHCDAKAPVEEWNTRPIEDALAARVAELEAMLTMPDGMRHADD